MSTKDQIKQACRRVTEELAFHGPLESQSGETLTSTATARPDTSQGKDRFSVSVSLRSSAHPDLTIQARGIAKHVREGEIHCQTLIMERSDKPGEQWAFRFSCGIEGDHLQWRPLIADVRPA